jgi:hypothetical protein
MPGEELYISEALTKPFLAEVVAFLNSWERDRRSEATVLF